jgi:hypothetical protein
MRITTECYVALGKGRRTMIPPKHELVRTEEGENEKGREVCMR